MEPSAPNPYQAPTAAAALAEEDQAAAGSASRWARWWAAFIDGLISLAVFAPLQYSAGVYDNFPNLTPRPFAETMLWSLGGVLLWVAVHGVFLARSAQTIGKKIMGIQVVNVADNRPAPLFKLVVLRFLPMSLVPQVPMVGPFLSLANALFIFRKDRRCIHDHIAGTRVIAL